MKINTKPDIPMGKVLYRRGMFYKYWQHRYLTLMFLIPVAYYIIFHYIPIYGVQIAFKEFKFRQGIWGSPWIGFQNFKDLFAVGSFWEALRNSILISIYKLVWGFPAPVIFAILLNELKNGPFKKVIQTVTYLPHFVSWIILSGIFMQFLSPASGPINLTIKAAGLDPIYFLADPKWFRSVLVATEIWKGFGWGSIIYLATISGINPELYEAAIVDGASRFRRIWYITLPSLTPVITIMLIFRVGSLIGENFDQIFNMMISPTVYSVGDVLETYTYRLGLNNMRYSFATAVGLFKNIVSFIMILAANSIAKKINDYGIW